MIDLIRRPTAPVAGRATTGASLAVVALLAGRSGYDVVVPSEPFLLRLGKAVIFRRADRARLPNLKNAWPEIAARLATFDPGNLYAVDYMWGTTGIGVNLAKVRQRLGDGPLDPMDPRA